MISYHIVALSQNTDRIRGIFKFNSTFPDMKYNGTPSTNFQPPDSEDYETAWLIEVTRHWRKVCPWEIVYVPPTIIYWLWNFWFWFFFQGLQDLCDAYSLAKREYYFDRSPRNFDAILGLYRTDKLHLSQGVSQQFLFFYLIHILDMGGDDNTLLGNHLVLLNRYWCVAISCKILPLDTTFSMQVLDLHQKPSIRKIKNTPTR